MFGAVMTAVLAFPLFWLFDTGSTPLMWLALLLVFLCSHAPMYAPQGAFFSELFGTSVRYSGASLGAQLSAAVAGGFSPLIATALLPKYGPTAIAIYIIGLALITIVAVWSAVETMRRDLEGVLIRCARSGLVALGLALAVMAVVGRYLILRSTSTAGLPSAEFTGLRRDDEELLSWPGAAAGGPARRCEAGVYEGDRAGAW